MGKDYGGGAQLYKPNSSPDYSDAGGGMSASENRMANYKCRSIGDYTGAPKSTAHGADTGKDATNVIMELANAGDLNDLPGHMDEVTPSATRHSPNRGENPTFDPGVKGANRYKNQKG